MEEQKITLWKRFRSAVPINERKIQLILVSAAATLGSIAAISFPGKLAIVSEFAGYLAASCTGMAFIIQFAMNTQQIIETKDEVKITSTNTVTTTQVPILEEPKTESEEVKSDDKEKK